MISNLRFENVCQDIICAKIQLYRNIAWVVFMAVNCRTTLSFVPMCTFQGWHCEVFNNWVYLDFFFFKTQSFEMQNWVLLGFIADESRLIDYRAMLSAKCQLASGEW